MAVIFAVLFAFAFLPRSIGIYANRRAGGRRVLLAGLAAQAPSRPAAPLVAASVAAPLEVAPGALVVRCVHCGADSAVRVRTPFLAHARKAARAAVHTVDEAVALDRRERADTRRTLARELRRYIVVTSIFGGLFATFMWDDARANARDDSAPALGLIALIAGTLLLIVLMFRSMGSDPREEEEAKRRRVERPPELGSVSRARSGSWVCASAICFVVWR